MGTIAAQIELYDMISAPINNIMRAVTLMTDNLQGVDGAINGAFNTEAIDNMTRSISLAQSQMDNFTQKINKPSPIPEQPKWQSVDTNIVFTTTGLERFEQETNATNNAMEQMITNQQRIANQARQTDVFAPEMITDLQAMNTRVDGLRSRIAQINNNPIDNIGANAVNNDIERLNNQLRQSLSAQDDLTRAMDRKDVSAAYTAYARLNNIVDNTDVHIRENMNAQNQFNKSIKSGSSDVDGMSDKIMGMIGAYVGIQSIGSALNLSDSMSQTTARLSMTLDDGGSLEEFEQKIFESSQRSRSDFMETANVVAQLGQRAGDTFSTNDETIQFAENLNKSFAIAGASQSEIASASLQLTQALGSGVLRGEELNAVFEASPNVIQTIADYIDVPIGKVRELASEGLVSADIVKNAMLSATDEINAQYELMPVTFGEAWNVIQGDLLMTFQPMLDQLAEGATWIHDNWSELEPVFWGLTSAVGAYTVGIGLQTTATWIATGAAETFFATLLKNPFFWIALSIGYVVQELYKFRQEAGSTEIAWLKAIQGIEWEWNDFCMIIQRGAYDIVNLLDIVEYAFIAMNYGVLNGLHHMVYGFNETIQDMINDMVDGINSITQGINAISGSSIEAVAHVNLIEDGERDLEERKANLAAYKIEILDNFSTRDDRIRQMQDEANNQWAEKQNKIDELVEALPKRPELPELPEPPEHDPRNEETADNTGAMADSLEISDENLQYLRDAAERDTVNRYTTAEIKVDMSGMQNNVNSDMDLDGVIDNMITGFTEGVDISGEGVHE